MTASLPLPAGRDAPAPGPEAPLPAHGPESPGGTVPAFDALADGYDEAFTESLLGTLFRRAVWRRVDASFGAGDRILDLGCGTGEDALHLARRGVRVVAVDASEAMLREARAKIERHGVADRVELRRMPIEDLHALDEDAPFDGVLSNFGALNVVDDLSAVARDLAARTSAGAPLILCLMGPVVPWEWAWYLVRGRPRKAFRRLRRGGAAWRGLRVRYPSIRRLRREFDGDFRVRSVRAVGALVPPPYAEAWARRRPRLVGRLDALERRFEAVPPLPWLADHYVVELARR